MGEPRPLGGALFFPTLETLSAAAAGSERGPGKPAGERRNDR